MIKLIEQHAKTYSLHCMEARLEQVNLTRAQYRSLYYSTLETVVRESAIPEEDVKAVVQFLVDYPHIGAGKAHDSLIDRELAYLSTSNINTIKKILAERTSKEYQYRKEQEKLLEAQLREELLKQKKKDYQHKYANGPNDIWAMDFVNLTYHSRSYAICVVYDEYSQNYLSIRVDHCADHQLAKASLLEAFSRSPKRPNLLRRDNGKPFLTETFQAQLHPVQDYPIPPHSPWFNGSLESCNTSLKATIRATGMKKMAENSDLMQKARNDEGTSLEILQELIDTSRIQLNQEISRLKHHMPPAQVYNGHKEPTKKRHQAYIDRKKKERVERMAVLQSKPETTKRKKSLLGKAKSAINKTISSLETNTLYVLNEILHQRHQMFEI